MAVWRLRSSVADRWSVPGTGTTNPSRIGDHEGLVRGERSTDRSDSHRAAIARHVPERLTEPGRAPRRSHRVHHGRHSVPARVAVLGDVLPGPWAKDPRQHDPSARHELEGLVHGVVRTSAVSPGRLARHALVGYVES